MKRLRRVGSRSGRALFRELIFIGLLLMGRIDPLYAVEVNLYTGTATHLISIDVPAGPGGLAPSLALTYNGTETNGWLGLGWAIQGISYIETIGPEAKGDGTLSTYYRLVLNGTNHKLIRFDPAPDGTPSKYFRTEQETFLKIINVRPSEHWVVKDRNGVLYFFGGTFLPDYSSASILGHMGRMYLTEIRDPNGNRILYTYKRIPNTAYTASDLYPDKITWGPGGNMSVTFNWESRTTDVPSDIPFVRIQGPLNARIDQRLGSVEVKLGTQLIRRYVLGYSPSAVTDLRHAPVTQLTSVRVRGSDDSQANALPPTILEYQVPPGSYTMTQTSMEGFEPSEKLEKCVRVVDWNNDGLEDVVVGNPGEYKVYLRDAATPKNFLRAIPITVPSGTPALPSLCETETQTTEKRGFYLGGEGSTDSNGETSVRTESNGFSKERIRVLPVHDTELVDLDADGLVDLLHRPGSMWDPKPGNWIWRKNLGGNQFGPELLIENPPPVGWFSDPRMRMADMNGDGLLDFVWFYSTKTTSNATGERWWNINWWANVGNGKFKRPSTLYDDTIPFCGLPRPEGGGLTPGCAIWSSLPIPENVDVDVTLEGIVLDPFYIADMNGDGLPDFTFVDTNTGTPIWRYFPVARDALSQELVLRRAFTMTNPVTMPPYDPFDRDSSFALIYSVDLIDVNGDGLTDVLSRSQKVL